MPKTSKLIGTTVGRLLVLHKDPENGKRYICQCECGNKKAVLYSGLWNQTIRSCGCLKKERMITNPPRLTHGATRGGLSPTYQAWSNMLASCSNTTRRDKLASKPTVCERWRRSYENFLADLGEKPADTRLTRIDKEDGYHPGNVSWQPIKKRQPRPSQDQGRKVA